VENKAIELVSRRLELFSDIGSWTILPEAMKIAQARTAFYAETKCP